MQGWDTRAALLLIGRRWAERGGAGAVRAARGLRMGEYRVSAADEARLPEGAKLWK